MSLAASAAAQNGKKLCFTGPVRAECAGFLVFEASAVASASPSHEYRTVVPRYNSTPDTLVERLNDLPSYFAGSIGYLRVVGDRHARGIVGTLGYGNQSALGNTHRIALSLRDRREIGNATVEMGAGALAAQVFIPGTACCFDRVYAYGASVEGALTYHDYIGVTGGLDVVHGGGRTSPAVRAGIRTGSWAAVATSIIVGAGAVLLIAALAGGT